MAAVALRTGVIVLAALAASTMIAACGSSASPADSGTSSQTVSVAYAGSLAYLNDKVVGPAFSTVTGYAYSGRGAGADALSQEIASGEITPNVFESVGAKPIEALLPKFTKWYIQFAASQIVLAYNPASSYAGQFSAIAHGRKPMRDLFTLLETPGLKLGRTDPNLDPQGAAFIEMLILAGKKYHLPAGTVGKILGGPPASSNSTQIFPETALDARLEAGQVDAASAYLSQAVQLHLPYIKLPASINLGDPAYQTRYAAATFRLADGTVVHGKPLVLDVTEIGSADRAAAAFIKYTLSPRGQAIYKSGGYTLLKPVIEGDASAVPASIRSEVSG